MAAMTPGISTSSIAKCPFYNGGGNAIDDDITQKIEMVLEANMKAQRHFLAKLCKIAALKRNLALSMKCTVSEKEDEHETNSTSSKNGASNRTSRMCCKRRKITKSTKTAKKDAKGWEMNESRKWTRRFFIDPNLSTPVHNDDTIKRRKWEGRLIGKYKTRYTPWTKDDISLLTKCVEDVKIHQGFDCQNEDDGLHDRQIDFKNVFDRIKEQLTKTNLNPVQIKKNQNMSYSSHDNSPHNGAIRLRCWTDYRNKYLFSISPSINKSPFTKKELEGLVEILEESDGCFRWDEIPKKIDNARTAFQCFKQIQMNLIQYIEKMDATEDELLLKYVAAAGPQFVVNHHSATSLSQRLFPHLSARQICVRLNSLLVNPNYKNEKWSDFEERMLVLGMKAFSENISPLTKVAALLPRASKLITDKWNRSLNPIYCSDPFTRQEDEKLVDMVREKKQRNRSNWKEISEAFPLRHPRSLLSRYVELTKDESVKSLFDNNEGPV